MKPSLHCLAVLIFMNAAFLFLNLGGAVSTAQAQQIQVTAADPSAAAQGTVNLNVKVTGKGFKNGAKTKFFVTGTTDTGGVTVNSTTFVNSTELTANITVADAAVIANFDIQATNPDGRGGKGTELFAVTPKGGGPNACPTPAPPPTGVANCYGISAGCLDTTFGVNGLVITSPGTSQGSESRAVLVQTDGKIVVAGDTPDIVNGTGNDFVVVRYNVDGTLDTTFGDPDPANPPSRLGYVRTSFSSTAGEYVFAAALQSDGKIIVSGSASVPSGQSSKTVMAVARYSASGSLDLAFGSAGKMTVDMSGAFARAVAIQADGKIVLVGDLNFSVARLNPNGSLDASFGTGGTLTVNPSTSKQGSGKAFGVVIQRIPSMTGEERIVVGGWAVAGSSATADFALMRFKPNGAIDGTFGSSGRVLTDFFGFGDYLKSLALDANNRIVAVGETSTNACGLYAHDFGIARYNENGSLDSGFNGNGRQTADIYGGWDIAQGIVIQPDGKIVISGNAHSSDNSLDDFALLRLNSNGTRDSSFGLVGNGIATTDFFGSEDWSYAVTRQPSDGKIVASGVAYVNGLSNIAVARYWP
jgi:uncharacterized delta-60 repeat protein